MTVQADEITPRLHSYSESPTIALNFAESSSIDITQRNLQCNTSETTTAAPEDLGSGRRSWLFFFAEIAACVAVWRASLMRAEERKKLNNNPYLSTPIPGCGSMDRDHALQPSPVSVIDAEMEDVNRASPVDSICTDVSDDCGAPATEPPTPPASAARPRRSAKSRTLMADAANLMRDVYIYLVRQNVLITTDILEGASPLECPSLDPMGVLFSAQTLLRHALTEELLAAHGMDLQIRMLMATVLLMSYKLRSESTWNYRLDVSATMMTQFLLRSELPLKDREAVRINMLHLEVELVSKMPIHRLIDETAHSGFEWTVYEYYNCLELDADQKRRDTMLALSGGYFFFHAVCIQDKEEFLEIIGESYSNHEIGKAIAYICITAVSMTKTNRLATPSVISPTVSRRILHVCALLAVNAQRLSSKGAIGLRVYATKVAHHACQQIVGAKALVQLAAVFSPFLP